MGEAVEDCICLSEEWKLGVFWERFDQLSRKIYRRELNLEGYPKKLKNKFETQFWYQLNTYSKLKSTWIRDVYL